MQLQLIDQGIETDIIRNRFDLEKEYIPWEMPTIWRTEYCNKYFDFVLISYTLGLTGAPLALLNLARVLKGCGYSPIIVSNEDGVLKEESLKADIPVSIDYKLNNDISEIERWVSYSPNALINTIMYCPLLEKYSLKKHLLLWIHEAKQYYSEISGHMETWKLPGSIIPLAVGHVAAKNYAQYFKVNPQILLYGMEKYKIARRKKSTYTISIIGSICERKGQAILLKAYIKLPIFIKQEMEVWVIGEGDINFLQELSETDIVEIKQSSNIVFWGQVSQSKMRQLYSETDLLVCPSVEDPMPITVTEALMNNIPVITSDKCGTCALFNKDSSGLVFESGNIEELSEKLEWCYYHQAELEMRARNNETIFDEYFSFDSLQKRLKKIIKENL